MCRRAAAVALVVVLSAALGPGAFAPGEAGKDSGDPLPSWNDTPAKKAILDFAARVTGDRVAPAERVAVFDQDGTLWCEQPMYVQAMFMLDRIKALAPAHPEWKEKQPYKAVLEDDRPALAKLGEQGFADLIAATHAGMTTDEFAAIVRAWLEEARHPRFKRPYTELVYQPMLEVLAYLRKSGFKTFIVSGGGVDFMRVFADRVYGIPPEQVIGSSLVTKFEQRGGKFVLAVQPKVFFIDNRGGKPEGINRHIGRRPLAAFGNSDGDLEMLQWTTGGAGARFGLIVHHTDAEREYAYDRKSRVGRLDKALDEAPKRGWTVVDMKKDWKTVFAPPR
jgi:phosphoglycolate phosphatase-like HAD superfamily hydrolase